MDLFNSKNRSPKSTEEIADYEIKQIGKTKLLFDFKKDCTFKHGEKLTKLIKARMIDDYEKNECIAPDTAKYICFEIPTYLSVNNLSAGRYGNTNWNVKLDSTNTLNGTYDSAILNVTKMAATNSDITSLRATNLCASLTGTAYRLSAIAGGLLATDLSATTCNVVNLSSTNLSAYSLSAGANGESANLKVQSTGAIEVSGLIAHDFRAGGRGHNVVVLSSNSEDLSVVNLYATNCNATNCSATNLWAGIKSS